MDTENTAPTASPENSSSTLENPAAAIPPQPPIEQVDIDYFAKIKLRVGRVEHAEAIPKSKKLLRLEVDLGPALGRRQVLAGIAQFYSPESLIGKNIVVVSNLKPATLMGYESQGMLLAASEGDKLAIVTPEASLPPGSEVR